MTARVLPWQGSQWTHVKALHREDRMPHALLLRGPRGVGKAQFAGALAKLLLCHSPGEHACGECKACKLMKASSHPDFHKMTPPDEDKRIGIDQVRELIGRLSLTSSLGKCKLGLITPAERMTLAAANSLLKTLEEPPGDCVLILVTSSSAMLPNTIRSRCQTVLFPATYDKVTLSWLSQQLPQTANLPELLTATHGQPLDVLSWVEADTADQRKELGTHLARLARRELDPVSAAEIWKKWGGHSTLVAMTEVFVEIARSVLTPPGAVRTGPVSELVLQAVADRLDLQKLFVLYDRCLNLGRLLSVRGGLNEQIQLEEVAILWCEATRPVAR